jgi:hypothetical protein
MTLAGMIAGKPLSAIDEKIVALADVSTNFLLEIFELFSFCIFLGLIWLTNQEIP